MAGNIKSGSVKRFGARYGRSVRNKLAMVEAAQKKLHKCPYCMAVKVKRLGVGIYECSRCSSRFTGKAYVPLKKVIRKEGVRKSAADEEILEEEDTLEEEDSEEIQEEDSGSEDTEDTLADDDLEEEAEDETSADFDDDSEEDKKREALDSEEESYKE